MLKIDYKTLANMNNKQLLELMKNQDGKDSLELFIACSYLSMEETIKNDNMVVLELLGSDPRLSTAQIVQLDTKNDKLKLL